MTKTHKKIRNILSAHKMDLSSINTPISNILKNKSFHVVFKENQFSTFIVPESKFVQAKEDVIQRLKCKMQNGKCSNVLLDQITRHKLYIYEKFGNEIHQYHFQTILDIIETTENGNEVNLREFRNEPLKYFKHIHHNSNQFIEYNVFNHWKKKVGKKNEIEFQNQLLEKIFREYREQTGVYLSPLNCRTILLNNLLNETQFRKVTERTGEWIIIAQKNGINYYLCLATHNEANEFGDQVILERIKPCLDEFPELENFILPLNL